MRRLGGPVLLLALACNPGFAPQYRVTDLRILAVKAEVSGTADSIGATTADPDLDQTVRLEALVLNPQNRANFRVRWFVCAPSTTGQIPPCVDPTFLTDPATLASAGAFEIPGPPPPATGAQLPPIPLSALPQPVRDAAQQALQAAASLAAAQPTYDCRIYVEVPLVVFAQADGKQDLALKRVRLVFTPADAPSYDRYVANQNPVVNDAFRAPDDSCTGGPSIADPAGYPSGRATLCAQAKSQPESYDVCAADGTPSPAFESFGWQWYVSAGEFPDVGGLGNAEGSHLDFDRPPAAFTLWLILRDGRGGISWTEFDCGAAPAGCTAVPPPPPP